MNSRRKFLQQSSSLALAGLLFPSLKNINSFIPEKSAPAIGLQLYTLGDLMVKDPQGTLIKIAKIGYRELESASSSKGNFYGFTPKEFAALVKAAGMQWRSAHVGGVAFSRDQIMKMAKNAEDSVRAKAYADRLKDMPKSLNLTDNYKEVADKAAEGGVTYVVCSSIPVNTMDEIKHAVEVFNLPITITPLNFIWLKATGHLIISSTTPMKTW